MELDLPKFEERAARWANILSVIPGSYCAYALWDQRHTGGTSPLSQHPGFAFCLVSTFVLIFIGGILNFVRSPKKVESAPPHEQHPQTQPGLPTLPLTAEQVLASARDLVGDLCGYLRQNGHPVEAQYVSDGLGGLGDRSNDPEIARTFAATFSSRISTIRSQFGSYGLLGEYADFSSVGDVLSGISDVVNSDDVRGIIEALETGARSIKEKFLVGVPFNLALPPLRKIAVQQPPPWAGYESEQQWKDAVGLQNRLIELGRSIDGVLVPLQIEALQLAKALEQLLKELPEPQLTSSEAKDGAEYVEKHYAWEKRLRAKYVLHYQARATTLYHRFAEGGQADNHLACLVDTVKSSAGVSDLCDTIRRLAFQIEV